MDLNRPFFPNLNGLRFLGALLVFVFHVFTLGNEMWGDFFNTPVFQAIYKLASKGHHGVGLFFALSGFLITFLLLNEVKKNGSINVPHFLMRRILRIWPLYFAILIFGFFIFPSLPFGQETLHSAGNYALFLSNLDEIWHGAHDPLNFLTVTWSVSIEEQYYLTWIVLLFLFPFFRKGKYFPLYFISIIASVVLFRFLHFQDERTMYYHTFSVVSDLAIGSLSAYSVYKYSIQNKMIDMPRIWIVLIYLIGSISLVAATKIFPGELRSIERLIQGCFFAFIVLEQVYCKNSFIKMDRIPGFFKAGELTYGFYMYHCIYIYYWGIFFKNHNLTDHIWQFIVYFIVIFISTYLTAFLSFRYIEKPILNLKRRFRD